MRKTIFGVACSADTFIAREDGGMDWVRMSDEVLRLMREMFRTIDTIVMGRRTYDATVKMGSPLEFGVPILVCSRHPADAADQRVTFVERDAVDLVRELKASGGQDICIMGGGALARSLLEERLIDELHLTVHPVLLGRGVPLYLPLAGPVELRLLEARTLPHGCVGLSYRVA